MMPYGITGLERVNTARYTQRFGTVLRKDLILFTRIMKARNTLFTRLQDTNHRKQKSSIYFVRRTLYFVLVTQAYSLSKSKLVFILALVGYTASIARLDSITLTYSILPEVELSMYLRFMLI